MSVELEDDEFTEECLLEGFPVVKPLPTSTRVADGKSPRHSYKVGFDTSRIAYMKISRTLKILQRAIKNMPITYSENMPITYSESTHFTERADYTVPNATPGELKLYRANHRRLIEASDDRLRSAISENERDLQNCVETRMLRNPLYACFKNDANSLNK